MSLEKVRPDPDTLEWKLEIRKVQNGYILKGKFGDSDLVDEIIVEEGKEGAVFNNDGYGHNPTDLTAMRDVLYEVMEYFAVFNSKHDKNILSVNIQNQQIDEIVNPE